MVFSMFLFGKKGQPQGIAPTGLDGIVGAIPPWLPFLGK